MATVGKYHPKEIESEILIDVSAIGRSHTRAWITKSIEEVSGSHARSADFWNAFFKNPKSLPKHMIVVGDFAEIVRSYFKLREHHWTASVRNSLPVMVALLRTKRDSNVAGLVDDVLKHSDSRLWVCDNMLQSSILDCLSEVIGNCNPRSIIDVRFPPNQNCLWVEFSDGFSGFIGFSQLGIIDILDDLIVESALVGQNGYSVQMLKTSGEILDIDSDSIRATLDAAHSRRIAKRSTKAISELGEIIRHTRYGARLTQMELSKKTGIDQALISKMEQGMHRPRIDTLRKIAAGLGTDVSSLLSTSK